MKLPWLLTVHVWPAEVIAAASCAEDTPMSLDQARKVPGWPPVNQLATFWANWPAAGALVKPWEVKVHSSCATTMRP